jgi:Uma2 family endonuclease
MSANRLPHLSPDEYLALERAAEEKSEYHDGRMYALAGAGVRHNLIAGNVLASIHGQLRGSRCKVYGSDMRVWIPRTRRFTYPDLSIVSGRHLFHDEHKDNLLNPIVIVEVLSPSTEAYDRGEKFEHYQTIETLQEYVLISQTTPRIERYARQAPSSWLYEPLPPGTEALSLISVPCRLTVEEIYADLEDASS